MEEEREEKKIPVIPWKGNPAILSSFLSLSFSLFSFFRSLFTQPLAHTFSLFAHSSIDPIGTEGGGGGETRPAFLVGDAGGGTMRRDMSRVPKCPRRAINWNSNGHKHLPATGQCQQDVARSRGRTPLRREPRSDRKFVSYLKRSLSRLVDSLIGWDRLVYIL